MENELQKFGSARVDELTQKIETIVRAVTAKQDFWDVNS